MNKAFECPTPEDRCIDHLQHGELRAAADLLKQMTLISPAIMEALVTMMQSPESVHKADKGFLPYQLVAVKWRSKGRPGRNVHDVIREQALVTRVRIAMKSGLTKTQAVKSVAAHAGKKSPALHEQTLWKLCKRHIFLLQPTIAKHWKKNDASLSTDASPLAEVPQTENQCSVGHSPGGM